MANKKEMTTVQVDVETRDMLQKLADANFRSMSAQVKFMVVQALQMENKPYEAPLLTELDGKPAGSQA